MTRAQFSERLRLQLSARYHAATIDVDASRFALRVVAPGIDLTLPLAPLHHACERTPDQAPALIAEYVTSIEQRMTPQAEQRVSTARLLWCVRSRRSLERFARAGDLVREEVGAGMSAFIAEELPGSIMRGVPRDELDAAGVDDPAARQVASENTSRRFVGLVARIRQVDRIPADGWRMAADPLFQGSVLMAREVLMALTERAAGDMMLGVPDRGLVLALPAALPSAGRFGRRVLREWREAMNPCSRDLLITDGVGLREVQSGARTGGFVLPWLAE